MITIPELKKRIEELDKEEEYYLRDGTKYSQGIIIGERIILKEWLQEKEEFERVIDEWRDKLLEKSIKVRYSKHPQVFDEIEVDELKAKLGVGEKKI